MALKPIGSKGLLTINGIDLVKFVPELEAIQIATDNAIGNGDATTLQAAKDDATTKANTAKTNAIADATTKYGGLPARVTTLETVTTRQSLGTQHLDTVTTPGIYSQSSSGTATPERGYPEGFRGMLFVYSVFSTNIAQEYVGTFTQAAYLRERSGGTWSAWKVQTPNVTTTLGTANLDDIKEPGTYGQGTTGDATTIRNYPITGRGILTVRKVAGSNIGQEYWATFERKKYIREFYNGSWGGWLDITGTASGAGSGDTTTLANDIAVLNAEQDTQDARLGTLEAQTGLSNPVTEAIANGDGTLSFRLADGTVSNAVPVPASLPTDQVDYTEITRRKSNTKTMQVKKTGTNDEVEVSCIGPSGHVTYKFAGAANGSTAFDDYRVQRDVWVGAAPGGVPAKDKQLALVSNKEFALMVAPVGQAPEWVPYHGTASAFTATAPQYLNNGAPLDVSAMANGSTVVVDKFELVQHVYGRHTSDPATNIIEVWTSHTITPDGRLLVTGKWRALVDVVMGNNYVIMCPVAASFDTVVSSLNNSYPNNPGMIGTNTALPESDTGISYVFLNSADRGVGVAVTYRNIPETLRRGQPNKAAPLSRAWLEHRTGGTLLKLYNSPYASGTVLPAGTVHRFSGDYQFIQAAGLYDQLAR